ncbi:potassium-transporting ATPase subunit F [Synechocystis sp. B12]|nr:potassium-transporting ATPase subunit F [Synechocystis sp. B12]
MAASSCWRLYAIWRSPPIHAAGNGAIDRGTAYALGLLVIIVLGLAVYLAMVIIEPERF